MKSMNISYVASSGNMYGLTTRPLNRILTKSANYHTWEFEAQATAKMYGERVATFKKKAATYQTVLIIPGGETQRKAILTALHDDFERDVRNLSPGRIMFGEWYCECYIIESTTRPDEKHDLWTENTIEIYVPSGVWVKEESRTFTAVSTAPLPTGFLDYQYDYEYDYTPPMMGNETWETDAPFPSDFRMEIYGPCVNPQVTINGYPYLVNAYVPDGSTLVIDSANYTVTMGTQNLFDLRNKAQSVFEKIPAGALDIEWGGFDFGLTLYEERSEPKW